MCTLNTEHFLKAAGRRGTLSMARRTTRKLMASMEEEEVSTEEEATVATRRAMAEEVTKEASIISALASTAVWFLSPDEIPVT